MEQVKERLWEDHFLEFGRGVHMFRTEKIQRLVAMGIPESLRGELWMTLSGKIRAKGVNVHQEQTFNKEVSHLRTVYNIVLFSVPSFIQMELTAVWPTN